MSELSGQRAVVTGAGNGIGRTTALRLARAGARVAVFDLDADAAGSTVEAIAAAGGEAIRTVGSVAEPDDVVAAFRTIDAQLGGIDILVNNAGISGNKPALDISDAEWRRATSINLDGVFYCSREAGRRMVAQRRGAIVNIGSIYSLVAAPNRLAYCTTKAGVEMMTRTLAIEWAGMGVRVNSVAPGYVMTDLLVGLARDGKVDLDAIRRRTPQGRLCTVDDVADAVLYLCEPRSAHITGHTLPVDGGWTVYGFV